MAAPAKPQFPQTFPEIRDFTQFSMSTPSPGREDFKSRLLFGVRDGAARITLIPNANMEEYPKAPKVVGIGIAPAYFNMLLDKFEEIVLSPENDRVGKKICYRKIAGLELPKFKDLTQADLEIFATVHYGKNKDGICFIGIEHPQLPRVAFKFGSSIFHHFVKPNGEKLTEDEASVSHAKAHIAGIRQAYVNYFGQLRPPFEPKIGVGANAAGGGQKTAGADGAKSFSTEEDTFEFA